MRKFAPISAVLLGILLNLSNGCSTSVPSPLDVRHAGDVEIRFRNITDTCGVAFSYQTGEATGRATPSLILESLGGGAGILDYDGDGWPDLLFPGGGKLNSSGQLEGYKTHLYRNLGSFQFIPVADLAGLALDDLYTHGCSAADFDNDGFTDVLVTGYGGVQLWHNQGDGTFREIHRAAGLVSQGWNSSAGWADFDKDGSLDLYLVRYVNWSVKNNPRCTTSIGKVESCSPKQFDGLADMLFFSNGDGTFRDVSREAPLRLDGKGLGVVIADLDLDDDMDIYVGNDTTDNFLYLNLGGGKFEEVGLLSGTARDNTGTPNGSMGVDVADFNCDGLPDIGVANFERESFGLYRNDGGAVFQHVSEAAEIRALGGLFVSFGTLFHDFDRDGDEDLVIANGHVLRNPESVPLRQEALLLVNDSGKFTRGLFQPGDYFSQPQLGRGLAHGDLDGDGDADLVFVNQNEPSAILANETRHPNTSVSLKLIGRESNRDAIGARATLHTSGGEQLRMIKGGGSYLSQSDLVLDWGIQAGEQLQGITITWPSGQVQVIEDINHSLRLTIPEPISGQH